MGRLKRNTRQLNPIRLPVDNGVMAVERAVAITPTWRLSFTELHSSNSSARGSATRTARLPNPGGVGWQGESPPGWATWRVIGLLNRRQLLARLIVFGDVRCFRIGFSNAGGGLGLLNLGRGARAPDSHQIGFGN